MTLVVEIDDQRGSGAGDPTDPGTRDATHLTDAAASAVDLTRIL